MDETGFECIEHVPGGDVDFARQDMWLVRRK